jgi:tetratricopeptide (TPR) repeat protein
MLGLVCIYQGEIAQGQEYAKASLALFSEVGDRWGEGWSLLVIGYSIAQGRPTEAEQALTKALAICRKSDDQAVMGYVLQDLSAMMIWLGRYTQAQQYIDEAFSAFEMIGFTLGLGYALQRQGQLAIAQGDYGKAAQVLERSTAYFNESRIPANVGDAQLLLGTAFRLQRNYAKAEPLYQQTLALMTGANHKVGIARCLTCLGCLAHNRDELHRAEQFLREALAIWQSIAGQEAGTADVLRQLGQVLVSSGEHRHIEAREYFRQALELAISYRLTPIALDVCVGVAQLQAQAGETERAIELLTLAAHHAAGTFATKENARQLLATMHDQMPLEATQVARSSERNRDLWAVVQELLVLL